MEPEASCHHQLHTYTHLTLSNGPHCSQLFYLFNSDSAIVHLKRLLMDSISKFEIQFKILTIHGYPIHLSIGGAYQTDKS